jgi:hypothetical protein
MQYGRLQFERLTPLLPTMPSPSTCAEPPKPALLARTDKVLRNELWRRATEGVPTCLGNYPSLLKTSGTSSRRVEGL